MRFLSGPFRGLAALVLALLPSVPPVAAAGRVDDDALNRALGAHIEFLADDVLEGRGAGSAGHDAAARYVAARFRELGLRPGLEGDSWLQPVPLLEARLAPDSARFGLRSGEGTEELGYNLDYVAGPSFSATEDTVTAPLVFVGYGVRAPELGHDDLAGVDLRGKIAVVLAKAPPRFPATALAHHANARQKLRALTELGAVAVIVVPTPKDLEETPWARRVIQARFPAMRWTLPDGSPADDFPQLKGSASLSPQGAGKVFARSPVALTNALAAAQRNEPQSFPLNVEATLSRRSEHRRLSSPNVVGVLPGSDPRLAGESVVLTAHLDHQGTGTPVDGDGIYNGAYDNAIGVGMMLEAARLLVSEGRRPRRTVVFAAVTAEEKGLRGSEYLATHLPPSVGRPVANLNLDMVLVTAPSRRYTVLGVEHSTLRHPVEAAARRFGLELVPDPHPERVVFVRSDQYSFIRQGIPAIFPKVAEPPAGEAPASGISPETYLKQHYHRPSDDLRLPRDAASSVRFIRFMADIARRVANDSRPPGWNPGDFFGETFGRGAAR